MYSHYLLSLSLSLSLVLVQAYEFGTYECSLWSQPVSLDALSDGRVAEPANPETVCSGGTLLETVCLELGSSRSDGECIKTDYDEFVLFWSSQGIGLRRAPCQRAGSDAPVGLFHDDNLNERNECATAAYVAPADFVAAIIDTVRPGLEAEGVAAADVNGVLDCFAQTYAIGEDNPMQRVLLEQSDACAAYRKYDGEAPYKIERALRTVVYKDNKVNGRLFGVQCIRTASCKCNAKRGADGTGASNANGANGANGSSESKGSVANNDSSPSSASTVEGVLTIVHLVLAAWLCLSQ